MPDLPVLSKKGTNTAFKSPTENIGFFRRNQFWKKKLTNNDFLALYQRGSIAYKATTKTSNDLFDESFITQNEQFKNIIQEYNLHNINRETYKNAFISGKVIIFIGYHDGQEDLSKPISGKPAIDYFYVIPYAWIQEDKYFNNEIRDYYSIYTVNGSAFRVHESRVLRYTINTSEISSLEPAYNALYITDNILWSVGQTIWRVGQGFPVISITDPILNVDGAGTNEVNALKKSGVLRDISSESGFICDSRYKLTFEGASGVAIRPKEYYDIAFGEACIALEIPRQIVEGTAAGAITGSETNLKDYYSDISAKQRRDIQPLYVREAELFGLKLTDDDFEWQPLFKIPQTEEVDIFLKEVNSYGVLIDKGVLTEEMVFTIIKDKYPELNLESFDKLNAETKKQQKLNPFFSQNQSEQPTNKPEQTNNKLEPIKPVNNDSALYFTQPEDFKRAEYKKAQPFQERNKEIQNVEDEYLKAIKRKLDATKTIITSILVGYNTDAVSDNTALAIKKRLANVINMDKDVYADIVNRYIDQSFEVGLEEAKQKLNLDSSFLNTKEIERRKAILKDNSKQITFSFLDDINKEIGLLITDISLTDLNLSNTKFKEEIQSIFNNKFGRVETGVILETNRAYNKGLVFGFDESGLVTHKLWSSVIDDVTTPGCLHLNGEIVEIGMPFSTGDYDAPSNYTIHRCRSKVEPLTLTPEELSRYRQ